ncbi:unnamed protein product [Rotaria sp. Silwood2]|nr:unnamed protein product [Rotaria sp. Silwood2]CAF3011799.1 unnamed protein product [Rotaria sp. Silwood2]CAF3147373.1 unnamed protein product [Rotaria sp. Silwood2]CAF4002998.1 unnamed protein product [Rotaria sp. Silwood2]CAF4206928.1 unnamed protein product [Rotaria sp. Silwood2]
MNTTSTNFDYINNNNLVQIASRSEEFILPCLLLIGTTCNTLTFVVMRRGRMRHSSSCFYMAALAIADTFVLWIGCFNRWLELLEKQRPILACNMCCKLGTFAFFFFADCSVWITVAMTFERYIAVSQPLRASQICTIKRARYILLNIFIIFLLINAHFLWTFHLSLTESHCIPFNHQSLFLKYFTWFDSFKYSFCPFTLLITLNILIIKSLLNARNKNKLLEQQTSTIYNNNNNINSKPSSISFSSTSTNTSGNTLIKKLKKKQYQHISTKALAYRRVNRRLTTMLLTVSFAFCICSMPISIMQLIDAIYSDIEQRSKKMNIAITIGKIIAEISQYINHSSNFFLYAFTGRIFRHELWRLFIWSRRGFFSSSSQRLRYRAKKIISFHNPTQGVHEHFYSHGQCHTKIIIAPKHLLKIPENNNYRQSISSTYSLSQVPITKQNSQYQSENFLTSFHHLSISTRPSSLTQTTSIMLPESSSLFVKQKVALASFVEKIKTDQTIPLLNSSIKCQTIKPYGLTDITSNSL